jgi:hypothetical protein
MFNIKKKKNLSGKYLGISPDIFNKKKILKFILNFSLRLFGGDDK